MDDVAAELDRNAGTLRAKRILIKTSRSCAFDAAYHDEVDQGNGVELDVPPVHDAGHVDGDGKDDTNHDGGGHDVQTGQQEGDDENCQQRDANRLQSFAPDRQVLLVVHVEHAADTFKSNFWTQDWRIYVFIDFIFYQILAFFRNDKKFYKNTKYIWI